MDNGDNDIHLRVASFSAYLNNPEENYGLKFGGSIQDSPSEVTSPEEAHVPPILGRKRLKESEISVFGADKYFNMKLDYGTPEQANLHYPKSKPRTATTPSTISESSWNSQAALMPSLVRNPSQTRQKRGPGKWFFAGFGCSGPCLDKKSVHIQENVEPWKKQSQPGLQKIDHFTFPILDPGMENLTVKKQLEEVKLEEDARISLEVFGSNMTRKNNIAMNLERKLSMLTWDAIPKVQNLPATMGSGATTCDDLQSDASSDLFEIEDISGNGKYPFFTSQESENMSSCMSPPTNYSPSEASIEWSVITASAADFSIISDYDVKSVVHAGGTSPSSTNVKMGKTKYVMGKPQKVRSNGILGCTNQKAVNVAEAAYRGRIASRDHLEV